MFGSSRVKIRASKVHFRLGHRSFQWRNRKDDKPKLPLAGLIALLFAAVSSLIIYQGPIKTSRPIDKEAEKSASVVRDRVQARLWQDPFEAVASHMEKEKASDGKEHGHHASPGFIEGTHDEPLRKCVFA